MLVPPDSVSFVHLALGVDSQSDGDYLPGIRIDLSKFDLVSSDGFAISVEDEESGTCCPLVNRADKNLRLLHGHSLQRLGTTPARKDFCL